MPFQKGHRLTPEKYIDGYEDEFVKIKKRIENTRRPCGEIVRNYICICKKCGSEFKASHNLIQTKCANLCKTCKLKRRKANMKDGHYYGTRIYSIWYSMKCRCYYEKHPCYSNYGGRGITVCDEWKNSSDAFGDWAISNGYSDDLTLDRIDNDKGYSPENCRWATRKEQANNRRKCETENFDNGNVKRRKGRRIIEINGERRSLTEWCDYYHISKKTVEKRLYQYKWDVVEAITTPSRKRGN